MVHSFGCLATTSRIPPNINAGWQRSFDTTMCRSHNVVWSVCLLCGCILIMKATLNAYVALLFIPEEWGDADTDTVRRVLPSPLLRHPFPCLPHHASPFPSIPRSLSPLRLPSNLSSRSPPISVSVSLFSFYPPISAHPFSSSTVQFVLNRIVFQHLH